MKVPQKTHWRGRFYQNRYLLKHFQLFNLYCKRPHIKLRCFNSKIQYFTLRNKWTKPFSWINSNVFLDIRETKIQFICVQYKIQVSFCVSNSRKEIKITFSVFFSSIFHNTIFIFGSRDFFKYFLAVHIFYFNFRKIQKFIKTRFYISRKQLKFA